ncbi:high mobility group B protein 7-like [Salvia miltiorrhiza]|uniref:high mobility group B protein 7-like n=1 Tax=Salvia miltiorrhiza TaxID=226208 RepID=UPI0025AC18E1|nr:high mobility group B protein 7-like [Salvia miltiorrhiza]
MAGGGGSSNASRQRKRVEAESASSSPALKRARDGSAFTKCEECQKDVAVALISFHDCSLDAKIKMNLEAQVVEMAAETKKKPAAEKKKTKQTEPKAKKAKNPNAKKRPPTAFFLFMDDFRKSFKEANPGCKSVATVAKEGGEKWKSLSDDEKKVYTDRAAELKAEYQKALEADNEQDEDDSTEDGAKDDSTVDEVKDETNESSEKEIKEEKDDLTDEEVKEEEVAADDE